MLISTLFTSLALAASASAQSEPIYTGVVVGDTTRSVVLPPSYIRPTGIVRPGGYTFGTVVPMICHSVCWSKQAAYGRIPVNPLTDSLCVLDLQVQNVSSPTGDLLSAPREWCLEQLCEQGAYNHIYECLNCMVANGGESTRSGPSATAPGSASSSTPSSASDSASATTTTSNSSALDGGKDPRDAQWPAIDAEQADGWLRNITQYCRDGGYEDGGFEQTTVTATPTTTGPYETRYTAGETVDLPQWTQLATLEAVVSDYDASMREQYFARVSAGIAAEQSQTGGAVKIGFSVGIVALGVAFSSIAGMILL